MIGTPLAPCYDTTTVKPLPKIQKKYRKQDWCHNNRGWNKNHRQKFPNVNNSVEKRIGLIRLPFWCFVSLHLHFPSSPSAHGKTENALLCIRFFISLIFEGSQNHWYTISTWYICSKNLYHIYFPQEILLYHGHYYDRRRGFTRNIQYFESTTL